MSILEVRVRVMVVKEVVLFLVQFVGGEHNVHFRVLVRVVCA